MKKSLCLLLMSLFFMALSAQENNESVFGNKKRADNMNTTYHRSSWCNILVHHADQKYAEEILVTYYARPQSEKFNDHSLPLEVVRIKGKKYAKQNKIDKYVLESNIANDLVAKWFNRNDSTGYCNMNLIYQRGLEDASTEQIETSELTKRGKAILMDSGTDLIGNTFVLVHDIIYVDKGERNQNIAEGIKLFGELVQGVMEVAAETSGNVAYYELGKNVNDLSNSSADLVDDFEGFRVKIKTHLYRLEWQDDDNDLFFENYYLDENYYDEAKFQSWKDADYKLKYIGTQEVMCGNIVLKGQYDLTKLIKIIVYRTLDESIVKLQRNYEEFKIKEPIYDIDENGNVIAKIGMKEGVGPQSKYEVLERIESTDGTIKYKKVGELRPVVDKIWDNRFMAMEDGSENAGLGATTFKVTSGHNLYPGLLIREIKF